MDLLTIIMVLVFLYVCTCVFEKYLGYVWYVLGFEIYLVYVWDVFDMYLGFGVYVRYV